MPWLDELVILKNGKLIQKGTPQEIYDNPSSDYVAALFGEVNSFSKEEIEKWNLSKSYYFPNQIGITSSGIEAQVLESRFSGSHYWNKLLVNEKTIIQYSESPIKETVFVTFSKA